MKQRVITGVVGLAILGACMFLFDTIFFNVIIAIIALVATFEVLSAAKLTNFRLLCAVCAILTALIPFLTNKLGEYIILIYITLVFLIFLMLIAYHKVLSFKDAFMSLFISFAIGFSFSTFVFVRDMCGENTSLGVFYILLMLGGAWLSDTGAYFVGSIWGNKKLAPQISPKKTVEGAVGGLLSSVSCFLIIGLIFQVIWKDTFEVNFLLLALTGAVLSILSILGDLSASVIKRQCEIKDFGKIFPGHGGVLDRFDSVLFTAPALWVIATYFDIVI